jgi:hypothetical protein
MDIEIKNVKHSEFASQETYCFEATIYVDGKRLCRTGNDGHGGPDFYEALKGGEQCYSAVEKINAELGKEVIPFDGDTYVNDAGIERSSTFTLNNSLELVVGNLMTKWLQDKEIKTILRRLSYIKEGGLYQIQAKHKPTPANIEALMTASWWKPEYIMISGKPVDEARADLATINFFGEL